jgi:prevent-host-death family protein
MKSATIPAGEFKARCLQLITEVQDKRNSLTITRHGKPVAQLVPIDSFKHKKSAFGALKDTGKIVGDIISPIEDEIWGGDEENL